MLQGLAERMQRQVKPTQRQIIMRAQMRKSQRKRMTKRRTGKAETEQLVVMLEALTVHHWPDRATMTRDLT